jgi:hypothetical protein
LCEKHSIPYHHTGGYKEAIMGVYEHLREMGKKPVTEEKCKTKSTSLRL